MSRWEDPMWGWRDVVNDILHVAFGFLPLLLAWATIGSPWALTLSLATFGQGAVIEYLKETPTYPDSIRDLVGYFLAGVGGGLLLWLA